MATWHDHARRYVTHSYTDSTTPVVPELGLTSNTELRRATGDLTEEVEVILHPKPTNDPNDPLVRSRCPTSAASISDLR